MPENLIKEHEWKLIQARPYEHDEPVHMKELRAVVFSMRRRVRIKRNYHKNHLMLCDNLGMVLALEKGRCANRPVLQLLRRWSSYVLSSFSRTRVRWVVSELCPSDADSRRFGPPPGRGPPWAPQFADGHERAHAASPFEYSGGAAQRSDVSG